MERKNILKNVLRLIFIVVFNIFFFVIGGAQHPASVWIAYGFIHFSYMMFLFAPVILGDESGNTEAGLTIHAISFVYFVITFAECLVFILIKMNTYKASLLVNILVAAVYFVVLIIDTLVNGHTLEQQRIHEMELDYVRDGSRKLGALMQSGLDRDAQRQVEYLYDLIHSSPVKSDPSVYGYEQKVIILINALEDDIASGDINSINATIAGIKKNADERNNILKNIYR